jgi:hypothetical protein
LSLGQLVAGISLSVPTADVLRSTSVDCQWTADATDPASFGLFMQFSDATGPFTQRVPVITVQRGTALKGTVPTIMNVAVLGCVNFCAADAAFVIRSTECIGLLHMQGKAIPNAAAEL